MEGQEECIEKENFFWDNLARDKNVMISCTSDICSLGGLPKNRLSLQKNFLNDKIYNLLSNFYVLGTL